MRIVQIGSYPPDSASIKGGVEASVYGLSQELARDHNVMVIDVPRKDIEEDLYTKNNNIEVLHLKNRGKKNSGALSRVSVIIEKVKQFNPDICHIHGTNFFQLYVFWKLQRYKIPIIVTVHGLLHIEQKEVWNNKKTIPGCIKYLSKSFTEFLLISLNKKVIVDTLYVAEQIAGYRRELKIWRQPECYIIPQGIDEKFFETTDDFIENKLLSIGSINRRKGHDELIKAVVFLKLNCGLDISLEIAGSSDDSSFYKELVNQIALLELNSVVKIYRDLTNEEIIKLFESADIFVLHSREESQGIVFAEAMACGKPVVATKAGGIPYVIQHGRNGFLSDFSDIETFSRHIEKILNDKELRKRMSENNRLEAKKYKWEIITKSIIDIYNFILLDRSLAEPVKTYDDIL